MAISSNYRKKPIDNGIKFTKKKNEPIKMHFYGSF